MDSKKPIMDILKGWEIISTKDIEFLREQVSFQVVTIPEALAVEQLDDIFSEFGKCGIHVERLLINNVIKETDSPFLALKTQQQNIYVEDLYRKYQDLDIIQLPMFPTEVKGISSLKLFEQELFQK